MNPSPAPWEYENVSQYCYEKTAYAVVKDATGKALFDTTNSDVACISTEHDEGSVTYTDEQGRADLMLAAAAPDLLAALRPFTRFPSYYDLPDDYVLFSNNGGTLTVGDIRAANAAIKKAEGS